MGRKFPGIYLLVGAVSKTFWIATFLLSSLVTLSANSAPPELQTPEPVIYLADNIDEKDNLGWCIDTLGRGWSRTTANTFLQTSRRRCAVFLQQSYTSDRFSRISRQMRNAS